MESLGSVFAASDTTLFIILAVGMAIAGILLVAAVFVIARRSRFDHPVVILLVSLVVYLGLGVVAYCIARSWLEFYISAAYLAAALVLCIIFCRTSDSPRSSLIETVFLLVLAALGLLLGSLSALFYPFQVIGELLSYASFGFAIGVVVAEVAKYRRSKERARISYPSFAPIEHSQEGVQLRLVELPSNEKIELTIRIEIDPKPEGRGDEAAA